MAVKKTKVLNLSGDRDLGTVTKKLASGMFITSKDEKVPPLPGITIGTKVKLVKSRFEIVEGENKIVDSTEDADRNKMSDLEKENADLKKRMDAMEKALGEKGANVKTASATTGNGTAKVATPPKVGA